jgi:hypothetical protein
MPLRGEKRVSLAEQLAGPWLECEVFNYCHARFPGKWLSRRFQAYRCIGGIKQLVLDLLVGLGLSLDQLVAVVFPFFLGGLLAKLSKPFQKFGNLFFVPGLPQGLD